MSNTDSFIDEVTEEVRRDQLYGYFRRYAWIAVLVILLIVGGASWNEWRKAQSEAQAEALGDAIIAALTQNDQAERAAEIAQVSAESATARAVLDMIAAAELAGANDATDAVARLNAVAANTEVPQIYRDLAAFKALLVPGGSDLETRRAAFEAINVPGHMFRMLAAEQLALIDIEQGNTDAAFDRLQAIIVDAEASRALQQRAVQVMVALGGEPDLSTLLQTPTGAQDGG